MPFTAAPSSSIVFGDRQFSEPEVLPSGLLGALGAFDHAGLYVVLVRDSGWRPRPFRPVYFGESDGIWRRSTAIHEKWPAWVRHADMSRILYRALHAMPSSTRAERQAAESALIMEYKTPCNERLSMSLGALARLRS